MSIMPLLVDEPYPRLRTFGRGQWLPALSALSYCADLIRVGIGSPSCFGVATDAAALAGFVVVFTASAHYLHRHTRNRLT